jgi:hypothetical protein
MDEDQAAQLFGTHDALAVAYRYTRNMKFN